jgi:prepilin-type N-terminal cleavage/methylation domain-containing protein
MNKILFLKQYCARQAFTLMELMVVTIMISIITAFAIPSYNKAVNRAHERQELANLKLIAAAQEAYKARYGTYFPGNNLGNVGTAAINTALRLSIVPSGNDIYACNSSTFPYECYAAHMTGGGAILWQLKYRSTWITTNVGITNQGGCCDIASCPTVLMCP